MFGMQSMSPNQVIEMMKSERSKSLSHREWKHRMAGYGFAIRATKRGQVVESLAHKIEICAVLSSQK